MQDEQFDPAHVPEGWQPEPPVQKQSAPWKRFTIIIALVAFGLYATAWTLNRINMMNTGREEIPRPEGGFWQYEVKTIEMKPALSYEMRDYRRQELREDLNRQGNDGGELVALLPLGDSNWQAIFKRRSKTASHIPEYDKARSHRAIEAEVKAESEKSQREFDAISRRNR